MQFFKFVLEILSCPFLFGETVGKLLEMLYNDLFYLFLVFCFPLVLEEVVVVSTVLCSSFFDLT